MLRILLSKIGKDVLIGTFLIGISTIIYVFNIQRYLLYIIFDNRWIDVLYVLIVSFLPEILYAIGFGFFISSFILLVKYFLLPPHRIEKSIFSVKTGKMKPIIISFIIITISVFSSYGEGYGKLSNTIVYIDKMFSFPHIFSGYLVYVNYIIYYILLLFNILFIKPLYLFQNFHAHVFAISFILSCIVYHSINIRIAKKLVINRNTSAKICNEKKRFIIKTAFSFFFPIPGISIERTKCIAGKKIFSNIKRKRDIFCTNFEMEEYIKAGTGYYNFNVVELKVSTLGLLRSKVYRIANGECDVSVIPKIRKLTFSIRNPVIRRESGSLIKKQLGSSLEFADIREYTSSDPLNRIWWKGFAKSRKLMVKDYYSFAEDRWILAIDFTNPFISEKIASSIITFSRLFIELCSRKDIMVAIASLSPNFYFLNYESDKKILLSTLLKISSSFYQISTKGVEEIMKSLFRRDIKTVIRICKKKSMSLQTFYLSSILGKKVSVFKWERKKIFENSVKNLSVRIRRTGKILLLTDGSFTLDMAKRFRTMCEVKKLRHIAIVVKAKKEKNIELRKSGLCFKNVDLDDLRSHKFVMKMVKFI